MILVIVGPTSSGKTALAVELARKINGEVISADSRQVYKDLDIGTGKVTKKEMRGIPHHLLDVTSPKNVFSANDFVVQGRRALVDILKRGKVPIVCGGTGFYIDALLGHISLPHVPANAQLRAQLSKKTAARLFAILKRCDPHRAKDIDPSNPVRLIRAIEIAKALGKVPSKKPQPLPCDIEWMGLKPDSAVLRKKIQKRLATRMKQGMIEEVRQLHKKGLSWKRLEALGLEYRHLAQYLQRKKDKATMLEDLERSIWHYARRQMTYWRRNPNITWHRDASEVLRKFKPSL